MCHAAVDECREKCPDTLGIGRLEVRKIQVDGPRDELNFPLQILNVFSGEATLDTDGRLVLARDRGNPEDHSQSAIVLGTELSALKRRPHAGATSSVPAFLKTWVTHPLHTPYHHWFGTT